MDALILVDIQHDFCPGGALAVPEGDAIIQKVNALQAHFPLVVATQDWHPASHGSFAANHAGRAIGETIALDGLQQILWPVHCVQGSAGAAFHDALHLHRVEAIFRKGTAEQIDSYSGFFDNGHRKSTGLADYLRGKGVAGVAVVGLAADYCVKFTALDALKEGFQTQLITDAARGVNLQPEDTRQAFAAVAKAGGQLMTSAHWLG